ncbi:MAG: PAS domain-containing protein [Myxococcales bacterium]|nr:PAS domain-containing protein [Myxococcales bacterium]
MISTAVDAPVDFAALFAVAPTPMLVLAPDLTIVAANDAYVAVAMATRAQLIGRPLLEAFPDNPDNPHAEGVRNLRASLQRVLASRAVDRMAMQRYDVRGPDGAFVVKHWQPRNIPLLAPTGEVRSILHVVEDVTDQVRASALGDELRGQTREAAHERAVLERFFALSLDMMCVANVDGYVKRVSPAFDALGYDRAEWLARPFIDFVHPDDQAKVTAEVARLADGQPSVDFETRFRCKDGSYRWLAWSCAPEDGMLYAIARDVTVTRTTQDALARAKDAAEAANRELESFSYSVAHDLRAPLRGIDGFSRALLEEYADRLDDDGRKYLGFVRTSAQHMAVLIEDLLALSRVTRSEVRWGEVDLSALAHAAVARLRQSQPARHVEVAIEAGLIAHGDPRLLALVFDNLLGNAWKFTGKHPAPRVEVARVVAGGRPAYRVRDNGAGFDMAFAHKLFGVFQRLHSGAEFEGTGVGLATVRRIIGRHGGQVWAEGEVDAGASFYFTLGDQEATV